MIKATTINIVSKEASEKIIQEVFNKEKLMPSIEKMIISYAESGSNYCTHHISSRLMESWEVSILNGAYPIIKELESNGYYVILSNMTRDDDMELYITLYWGNSCVRYTDLVNKYNGGSKKVLYWSSHDLEKLN